MWHAIAYRLLRPLSRVWIQLKCATIDNADGASLAWRNKFAGHDIQLAAPYSTLRSVPLDRNGVIKYRSYVSLSIGGLKWLHHESQPENGWNNFSPIPCVCARRAGVQIVLDLPMHLQMSQLRVNNFFYHSSTTVVYLALTLCASHGKRAHRTHSDTVAPLIGYLVLWHFRDTLCVCIYTICTLYVQCTYIVHCT